MKLDNSRMIIFEGIPGSGKSTMVKRVYRYLKDNGVKAVFYNEGCENPFDLTWHAYLTYEEYKSTTENYPEYEKMLNLNSIFKEDYILVPYKKDEEAMYNDDLMNHLHSKEFCYSNEPVVDKGKFLEVFQNRWQEYVDSRKNDEIFTICESIFFQHQIHDLLRLYDMKTSDIIEHLNGLYSVIEKLNPVIFYISQTNVAESLKRVWKIRGEEGSEKAIRFWENRKSIENEAMSKLQIRSYVIDNSNYDWDKVLDAAVNILK